MYSILPETRINRGKRQKKWSVYERRMLRKAKKSLSYEIPKEIITDKNWTQANFEKRVCQNSVAMEMWVAYT